MIGATITKLRKQRKLTQAKFAEAIHVTQAAVSQWETGKTNPDFQQMFILADFFGVPVEALSSGEYPSAQTEKAPTPNDMRAEAKRLLESMTDEEYERALAMLKLLQGQK